MLDIVACESDTTRQSAVLDVVVFGRGFGECRQIIQIIDRLFIEACCLVYLPVSMRSSMAFLI